MKPTRHLTFFNMGSIVMVSLKVAERLPVDENISRGRSSGFAYFHSRLIPVTQPVRT